MKKLILLLFFALVCGRASAQDGVFDSSSNRTFVGIRAGFDLTCPSQAAPDRKDLDKYNSGCGGFVGAACNVPLWKNLYFEPGAQFYFDTMGYKLSKSDPDTGTNTLDCSISRVGLRIPFAFGYRFDFAPCSVSVFTGPVVDFCFSGHYKSKIGIGSAGGTGHTTKGNFSRTGFGWKFGAGVTVKRIVVELSGTLGTVSAFKTSPTSCRNNLVQIALGYNF